MMASAEGTVDAQVQPCPIELEPERALAAINAMRQVAQECAGLNMPAAGPLRWSSRLEAVARGYAGELSRGDDLVHAGLGSTLRDRLRASGYAFSRAGENLAAGQESLDEVLQSWIVSAKHCSNLMRADFTEVGLACMRGPGVFETYWVMNLGRTQQER